MRLSLADLTPIWAMTVHKAQGSQFDHVFLEQIDLDTAPESDLRRLWYTSVTRAVKTVHVIYTPRPLVSLWDL
jgi:ATP-dependent exoDNAse (exonuclease V) alpha subunit